MVHIWDVWPLLKLRVLPFYLCGYVQFLYIDKGVVLEWEQNIWERASGVEQKKC